jgi:hypothetical protein
VATIGNRAKGRSLLARYPLLLFFLLSFVLTWGYFWLVWAPSGLPDSLIALGGFGPAVSAFLLLAITSGMPGVLRLLRSIVHWRVGMRWYLPGPARRSGFEFVRFPGRTRDAFGFCRSGFAPSTGLPR